MTASGVSSNGLFRSPTTALGLIGFSNQSISGHMVVSLDSQQYLFSEEPRRVKSRFTYTTKQRRE